MATVDNRIVQLEFKNAEFARAMAATLEAIKALNEALKTVGAENSFADITDDAETMNSRVGTAIKTAISALPALGAKAADIGGRFAESGARMAAALLPIGKAAEEATKKVEQVGNAGESFERINAAAQRVNLVPISAGVEQVSAKFIALTTIAVTALSRITDKAIDTGTQLVNSLSLEQVGAGFDEYELKLGSIQTIMAGTGASLETVNQYLDELNTYADRTIYSFADMTQNIGKFTNAGVKLDTAVASIQGVAQVAAVSGANTNEASRAMYNFAQALSKGYVQLIDWKSIELANMGTVEFKQQLIDAAEAAGTLTKEGDKWVTTAGTAVTAQQGFNDSLTDAWLTTEVLTNTLSDYADETTEIGKKAFAAAQDVKTFSQLLDTVKEAIGSGFARSFEILIGDFDEAKELFTSINGVISGFVDNMSESRNTLLQGFKDLGGRDLLIQSLGNAFKYLGEALAPIREAFRNVFPPATAQSLFELTQRFSQFVQRMRPSQQTVMRLGRIFEGFFSAIKIGIEFVKALGRTIGDFFQAVGVGQGNFLELIASFGDFVTGLREGLVEGGNLKRFFASLDFGKVLDSEKFSKAGETIKNFFLGLWNTIKDVGNKIKEWFASLQQVIADTIDPTVFDATGKALQAGVLGTIGVLIGKLIKDGFNIDLGGGLFDSLVEVLQELAGVLQGFQDNLRASAILKIAGAIAILALSLALLAAIDAAALSRAAGAMSAMMAQLLGVMYVLRTLSLGKGVTTVEIAALAASMLLISGGLLLLAFAMKKIGQLDIDQIGKGLYGIASSMTIFVLSVNRLNAGGGLLRASASMILFAVGLRIMANAMEAIGRLNIDTIGKGLYGMASAMTIFILAMGRMPEGQLLRSAFALVIFSAGLRLMASAIGAMGSLNMDQIGRGLYTLASSLTIIILAMSRMPETAMIRTAAGLLAVSLALNGIAFAMKQFGSMSMDEIGKGLYTLASSLTLLGIAMQFMQSTVGGAFAVLLVATALNLLAFAMERFAAMSIGEIAKGLITMSLALGVMAGLMALLSPLGPALLVIGAGLILIGAASALLGVGLLTAAKGVAILVEVGSEGIATLIEAIRALLRVFPEIGLAIVDTLVVVVEAFPRLLEPIVAFLSELIAAFIELVPEIGEAVLVLVLEILRVLQEAVPQLIETGYAILLAFLQGINDNIGEITTLAIGIITNFIQGLTDGIPGFIAAVVEFFVTVLTAVASELGYLVPTLMPTVGVAFMQGFLAGLEDAWTLVVGFIKSIPGKILGWIKSGFGIFSPSRKMHAIGLDVILGFLNGIVEKAVALFAWFIALPGKILGYFFGAVGWLWDQGWSIVTGILNGIVAGAVAVWNWFLSLPLTLLGYFGDAAGWLLSVGGEIISGLWKGITDGAKAVWDFFTGLPGKIVGLIPNPVGILKGIGSSIMNGFTGAMKGAWEAGKGFLGGIGGAIRNLKGPPEKDAVLLVDIGEMIFNGLFEGMEDRWDEGAKWLRRLNPATEMDDAAISREFQRIAETIGESLDNLDMSPTIRPVVDLSEVEAGFERVGGLVPSVSVGAASSISNALAPSEDDDFEGEGGRGGDVNFYQTINAPEQLSTADIYRDSRNLITLAKDELEIP